MIKITENELQMLQGMIGLLISLEVVNNMVTYLVDSDGLDMNRFKVVEIVIKKNVLQ